MSTVHLFLTVSGSKYISELYVAAVSSLKLKTVLLYFSDLLQKCTS